MNSRFLRWLGVALLVQTGLLHLYVALPAYNEAPTLGALFAANFLASLVAAVGVMRRQRWGWMLGCVIAVVSITGYVLSRTIGLSGMEPESWRDPIGTLALIVEGVFLLTSLAALLWRRPNMPGASVSASTVDSDSSGSGTVQPVTQRNRSRWADALYPISAFVFVLLVSSFALWLDDSDPAITASNEQDSPLIMTITPQTFEDDYGIRVNLVAVTAMRGVVDLRLKIMDVDKARVLLEDEANHPAMWIGDQTLPSALIPRYEDICGPDGTLTFTPQNPRALIMPAHMGHMDKNLRDGGMYVMFYPNPQNTVQSGTPISLFFGNTRVGPITVQ